MTSLYPSSIKISTLPISMAPANKPMRHDRLACFQAAGSRPLIFSQWTMMLDILEWLLDSLKLPYVRLDGSTAVADRLTIVDM